MRIVVAGATGFIGSALSADLLEANHSVTVLTRDPTRARRHLPAAIELLKWQPHLPNDELAQVVSTADAVINLAGESIGSGRWTLHRKQLLRASRLDSTSALVHALGHASRPKVLINASAVGFYGNRGDEPLTEASTPGSGFLARLTADWEAAALQAEPLGVRVVLLRSGVVLDKSGGALPPMVLPFRLFAGGPLGSGQQWYAWIHRADLVGLIQLALEDESLRGPINGTAPNPVRQTDFARTLARVLHRPYWAPAPAFVLRAILGETADALILGSQRAVPEVALKAGYQFRHPELEPALEAILGGTKV